MDESIRTAPCGYVEFADDGTILNVNSRLLELVGYEPGELEGRRLESILTVPARIFYQTHIFPLLKLHSRAYEVYIALRSRSGADVPMLINAVRRERNGAWVNICVMINIQQRSEYEDAILQAKKIAEDATRAKDEFLAHVSHDLRSPLNGIMGWTQLLRSGKLDDATKERALEIIERSANAQSQLIEDILDSSRIISGKLRLNVTRVDLIDVINGALDVVRPAAEAKQIRLRSILDPAAGPVSGDPDRLQQIMWNLLTNAIKFTPKNGSVQLRLQRINSHIEISVTDTGRGISKDFLPFVFDRFRQETESRIRQGGHELGMSITRQLVELHGGTIRVESAGEDKGSMFTVELPSIIAHSANGEVATVSKDQSADHAALPQLQNLQIVLVDDHQDGREFVATLLRQAGAVVTDVGNVEDALQAIDSLRPQALVSDIDMPGQDGYALISAVRKSEVPEINSIPAIALTARTRFADRMRALSSGYDLHVAKPLEPAELITLIANLTRPRSGL